MDVLGSSAYFWSRELDTMEYIFGPAYDSYVKALAETAKARIARLINLKGKKREENHPIAQSESWFHFGGNSNRGDITNWFRRIRYQPVRNSWYRCF